jgi:hypothetical protein
MNEPFVSVPRDLLVKADSYLSLLWYRPSTLHDTELQIEIPSVIGELRRLSALAVPSVQQEEEK